MPALSMLHPILRRTCIFRIDIKKKERWGRGGLQLLSHSVMADSLRSHGLLPWHSPSSRVCLNSCPLSPWCHPIISSSVAPFSSCPQSFPASGSFAREGWMGEKKEMEGNKKRRRRRKKKGDEQTFSSARHWNPDSLSSVWIIIWEYTII